MKANLSALFAGLLFGAGLVISGMTNPAKVTGFLDLFGHWDPSLAFVMAGAIGVHLVLLRAIFRLKNPFFASGFQIPTRNDIDGRLVLGAAVFGIGWGLSGVCPGPGLVNLATGSATAILFVATMAVGILAGRRFFGANA